MLYFPPVIIVFLILILYFDDIVFITFYLPYLFTIYITPVTVGSNAHTSCLCYEFLH